MKARTLLGPALVVVATIGLGGSQGCASSFATRKSQAHLEVAIQSGERGTADKRNPLSFNTPAVFTVKVTAIRADGAVDDAFEGWVRFSSKPGTVIVGSGDDKSVRNVQLHAGVADGVTVSLLGAYGDTRLWAEDLGFIPGDPFATPQCADGIDNNGDGAIDFPADDGCAFANDDSEDGGSYVGGVSDVLYFVAPRIADVRGVTQGGGATSFPHEQVQIDTGWRGAGNYAFDTIVTRVASDGFYATDLADADIANGGRGYASVFAFNCSAPPRMRVCDRLRQFGGTSSDFFGFTEVNFPTWSLEEWDPTTRPCLVPEPTVLDIGALNVDLSTQPLLNLESSLVRVQTDQRPPAKDVEVHIAKLFGPQKPASTFNPVDGTYAFTFTPEATSCDLNDDGKVDFNTEPEKSCGNACSANPDCAEFSNYKSRNAFRLVMVDATGGGKPTSRFIQANASTSAQFDPVAIRGQTIRAFSGTLRYFSGGKQFTIEARCADDIVADPKSLPIPSDTACVHQRTIFDVNAGSN